MENRNLEVMNKAIETKTVKDLNDALAMIKSDADMYKRINAAAKVLLRAKMLSVKSPTVTALMVKLIHEYNCLVNSDIIDANFTNASLTKSCLTALNNIVDKECAEYKRTLEMCFNIADIEVIGVVTPNKYIFEEVEKLRKEHGVK